MPVAVDYSLDVATGVSAAINGDGEVEFSLPPQSGPASWNLRYSTLKDPTGQEVFPMELFASSGDSQEGGNIAFLDNSTLYIQLQPKDADGLAGPWSNLITLVTPLVTHLAFKDFKKISTTNVTADTQPDQISIATMTDKGAVGQTNTGLVFAAGDLLVIIAVGYRITATGVGTITEDPATGWSSLPIHSGRVGTDTHAVRILYKVASGSEDVVPTLLFGGGSGAKHSRAQYYALSYTLSGIPAGYSFAGTTTSGTPPLTQAVPSSFANQDPLFIASVALDRSGTAPDQTFSETPDVNEKLEATSGGVAFSSRVKIKAFEVDSTFPAVTTSMTDLGNLNTIWAGAIIMEQGA